MSKTLLSSKGLEHLKMELETIKHITLPDLDTTDEEYPEKKKFYENRMLLLKDMIENHTLVGLSEDFKELKVCLHKKNAHMLERNKSGNWTLNNKEITQEKAISELVEAVEDLGYWCQVAKDVLDKDTFDAVQESYEYHEE